MADLYTQRTVNVKQKCTPHVLDVDKPPMHHAYMAATKAKKVLPRPKRPEYQPTFVKQWRAYRKLTQEQLAERVGAYLIDRGLGDGYSHASIGRIENGKMPYTQPILEAMADALGTDCASLLIRDPTDPSGIWTIWEKALPAERATITEHAEIVVKKARRG
jgi:transcriptional regulator with XRE-family HTH domain